MQHPQIRPGRAETTRPPMPTVVALFRNASQANAAIQLLVQLGVPSNRLGVTPPEALPGGQGMLLSIPCPSEELRSRVETLCRRQGAVVRGQRT